MRRQKVIQLIGLTVGVAVSGLLTTAALVWHVPAFYRNAVVPVGDDRRHNAQEFLNRVSDIFGRLKDGQPWAQEFPQVLINSYLQDEAFAQASLFELPADVHEPRVEFADDSVRLGFRYGSGWCGGVVTVRGRVWLAAKEPNVVAVELVELSLGAVPLAKHMLLEPIAEAAREQGIDVTWYRSSGNPVALLRLQAHQPRPTFQLRAFETQPGKLVVSGKEISDGSPADRPEPQPADQPFPAAVDLD